MGIVAAGTKRFLVEWYGPGAPACPVEDMAGRLNQGAACISAQSGAIRLLMMLVVPADHYAFGVFAAESAEAVERVCIDAGAPAKRISTAIGWPSD